MKIDGSEVIICGTCKSLVLADDYSLHQSWHGRQTDSIEHLLSSVEKLIGAVEIINDYKVRGSSHQG